MNNYDLTGWSRNTSSDGGFGWWKLFIGFIVLISALVIFHKLTSKNPDPVSNLPKRNATPNLR